MDLASGRDPDGGSRNRVTPVAHVAEPALGLAVGAPGDADRERGTGDTSARA
jgi:hypothetical protein